ncbi:hypothetical protein R3P38DRAFT_312096 [Favolaschia claudopus]|uniref:Uncharacterized protein n=1 Tax=Favolaschia claudopus TaxID=2862362 RepID=A0AAW0CU86_9AGAR
MTSCDREPAAPITSQSDETIRYFLPEVGAWAVLTIDPVASLSEGAREVPEAVEACKRMVNKSYVALVDDNGALYLPWEPYNSYLLRFLQRGDPYSVPKDFIEPYMSVPVLPVTNETHISGRSPLVSSKTLPWSDCFLSISADDVVRSPSMWGSGPAPWKIDRMERRRIRDLMADDILDAQDKKYTAMHTQKDVSPPLDSSVPALVGVGASAEIPSSKLSARSDLRRQPSVNSRRSGMYDEEFDADEEGREEDEAGEENNEEPVDDLIDLVFFNRLHEKAMTTVQFTHDLSTVTELNDPADYYKELEIIERIEKEAAPRIEECRALRLQNEIQRAKEMDAAVYDEQTIDRLFERPSATEKLPTKELPEDESAAAPGSKVEPHAPEDRMPVAQAAVDAPSEPTKDTEAICVPPAQGGSPPWILRIKSMLKKPEDEFTHTSGSKVEPHAPEDKMPVAQAAVDATAVSDPEKPTTEAMCGMSNPF